MPSFAFQHSRYSCMVRVATSTSTPRSAHKRSSSRVSAPYWSWRIGCTAARRRTGVGSPDSWISSIAFSRERWCCRRPGSCPSTPGGIRPVAGIANRPSAPQTNSWLRVTPASARRSDGFDPAGLAWWNMAK